MNGPIVNLRLARKQKARADAAKQANANRMTHGLSAKARQNAKTQRETLTRTVEAHKVVRTSEQFEPPTS